MIFWIDLIVNFDKYLCGFLAPGQLSIHHSGKLSLSFAATKSLKIELEVRKNMDDRLDRIGFQDANALFSQ